MTSRHPLLVYTALRLVLFVVPFAVLMVFGLDLVWALLLAALGSSIASIFILSSYREALSDSISTRGERMRARAAERAQSEDEWDEANRAAQTPEPSGDDGRS
ncbi:MAG TPA: DUF4229 domain-containing protein [Actinomycetes bacterium]|nr:DUF4229 domain-containing protein [Actinomycetes bacterium]